MAVFKSSSIRFTSIGIVPFGVSKEEGAIPTLAKWIKLDLRSIDPSNHIHIKE
jgi:hypothetical protein